MFALLVKSISIYFHRVAINDLVTRNLSPCHSTYHQYPSTLISPLPMTNLTAIHPPRSLSRKYSPPSTPHKPTMAHSLSISTSPTDSARPPSSIYSRNIFKHNTAHISSSTIARGSARTNRLSSKSSSPYLAPISKTLASTTISINT